ncbi:hypothetical protein TNCV_841441 [Trichonephila clavipes]|nr:hypothetical protein TNCV_841441 [Trichonephila clavipes]
MDVIILKLGQLTKTTHKLAPPLLTSTRKEGLSSFNRFYVHLPITWRAFSGTRIHDTRLRVRYLDLRVPEDSRGGGFNAYQWDELWLDLPVMGMIQRLRQVLPGGVLMVGGRK